MSTNTTRFQIILLVFLILFSIPRSAPGQEEPEPPNILFAMADDISYPHMGAYGTDWIDTPAFDSVAEQGLLFTRAYTPNAKCGPSRSIILTGRHSWQLGAAANHYAIFPRKYAVFTEVLADRGYHVGYTGKGWGPGKVAPKNGEKRHLTGPSYQQGTYDQSFRRFLEDRPSDAPFFFWYGAHQAHRSYPYGSGIQEGNKRRRQIDVVPSFLPDVGEVRVDLLDYAHQVEQFDRYLGRMLETLENQGELDNTLVVVTADHGMPFPRAKGQAYEYSNHVPLAIMWADQIRNPGRVIRDYVDFTDLAPTFLDAAGITWSETPMHPTPGSSWMDLFRAEDGGVIDPDNDHVLVGKERHDIGRPDDAGYPIRGIVQDGWLYLQNVKPDCWPAGPPETGYPNVDGSPTKTVILNFRESSTMRRYWEWSFGKRPRHELYRLERDPGCVVNLADDPAYDGVEKRLRTRLFRLLNKQEDPRVKGNGEVFDNYPYAQPRMRNFYRKYLNGELDKSAAGWLNPSDFAQ